MYENMRVPPPPPPRTRQYRSVLVLLCDCVSSGSVNKLQVSTQRFGTFGTYRVEDQRLPRRIIAYGHSLKT